jgi:hypothetical protein
MQTRPFNRDHYVGFLNTLFEMFRAEAITGAVLIMDNLPFHKRVEVRNQLKKLGTGFCYCPRILHFSIRSRMYFPSGMK